METLKLVGKKVASSVNGRTQVQTPKGLIFISRTHGLKEGDVLNGTVTFQEVTHEFEADGVTKKPVPMKRLELVDFTSFKDQKTCAIEELEIAAIPNLVLDASYFSNSFKAAALSA